MGGAGARWTVWRKAHPRLTGAAIVLLLLFFGWAGYEGGWYWWGQRHLQAAQQALARHAWTEARQHLQACLRAWPQRPVVHFLEARAARRLELLDLATEHLDTCERLQHGPTQATRIERALIALHRGDLAGTEAFLRDCVQHDDPDAVEILDILSAALILQHRTHEAQLCLDDLLRRQPNHFDALVRRGWTAESMAWYPDAAAHFEKALALRPDADAIRLSLAEIQVALGRFTDAQGHFEQLEHRQPGNPSVRFGLARCLAGTGHKEEARQRLDELLADSPNDWKALAERGWLSVQLDRPAEAESYLRRAYSLAPPDLPLLIHLGDCLRLLGKEEESQTFRDKANQLKADFQRAAQLGDLIREQRPNDPALRHELACILLRLGKPQDAVHWFQTALEKDPAYRPTHEALAAFYEQIGDRTRALHHRRILQEKGPTLTAGPPP